MLLKPTLFSTCILAASSLLGENANLDDHPHKMNFSLSQIGYEYSKTDAVYKALDFRFTPLWDTQNRSFGDFDYWMNYEMKLGYNFGFAKNHHLIPYTTLGYSSFNMADETLDLKEYSYIGLGLKTLFTFGPLFEMGLHLKTHHSLVMMYSLMGYKVGAQVKKWKMEIGIPCIWHLGETKQWEIAVEPYYIQLPTINRQNYIGSRATFGFRF